VAAGGVCAPGAPKGVGGAAGEGGQRTEQYMAQLGDTLRMGKIAIWARSARCGPE
jgi:hypothetical protein